MKTDLCKHLYSKSSKAAIIRVLPEDDHDFSTLNFSDLHTLDLHHNQI